MKTERKLFIDTFVGNPATYLLNFLVRIAGFCLRINHSLDKPFKTIVISKYIGMGSIIQATPLIHALKRKFPGAKIIFITNQNNKVLVEHISSVDEVLTVNDTYIFPLFISASGLIFKLWKRKPDVFIDLEIYSNFSILITTFSLATNRLGFFKSDKKYKMGIFTHMMYFNQNALLTETYLQFARLLHCEETGIDLDKLSLSEQEITLSKKILAGENIEQGNYMVINPNASDLRLERRWPAQKFILLIEKIVSEFPACKIVLIGSKEEVEYVHTISSAFKSANVIDTSGKLSLVNLICLIKNAALLITNDTGPMHIGFSQGTQTIALFGPCSPVQFGKSKNTFFVYKHVYCSPCVHEFLIPPCKGNNQCMKLISVEEVWEIIKSYKAMPAATIVPENIIYQSEYILGQVVRGK